jgi:hypothetical protein
LIGRSRLGALVAVAAVVGLGAGSANASHPRSGQVAAAQKADKDARRYGAGATVERTPWTRTAGGRTLSRTVRVRHADGSRTTHTATRQLTGPDGATAAQARAERRIGPTATSFKAQHSATGELVREDSRSTTQLGRAVLNKKRAVVAKQTVRSTSRSYGPEREGGPPLVRPWW